MKAEDITKAVSVFVPLLIVSGLLNQIVYYKFFNVPIADFVSTGELLILFSDDILFYVLIYLGVGTVVALIPNFRSDNIIALKEKRWFLRYVSTDEALDRFFFFFSKQWIGLLLWVGTLTLVYFTEEKELFNLTLYVFIFELCVRILRWHAYEVKRKLRIKDQLVKEDESAYTNFSLMTLLLFLSLAYGVWEARDVKYKHKFINAAIVVDDKVIKSDSTSFYIGKTDNYVFFYNKNNDQAAVYPIERVQQIIFGEIVYWQLQEDKKKKETLKKKKEWWKFW
jgi:hypothetical protein